jgi:broad specificity phosphatase PhoE
MNKIFLSLLFSSFISFCFGQGNNQMDIKQIQLNKLKDGVCLDFIRKIDLEGFEEDNMQQIFIIRHGEPVMNKKGWKNRKEAIRYMEMYDSVGVYDFEKKPICLRKMDLKVVYTSKLPRAMDTAEKTFGQSVPSEAYALFNEFERKVIKFPNIKLPRRFWSISTRVVWMMGMNKKGIESFSQAKDRSRRAAFFLDDKAENDEKVVLFSHGFLNKYVKRYLKKQGYKLVNLEGQKYLGAYYFYKIKS